MTREELRGVLFFVTVYGFSEQFPRPRSHAWSDLDYRSIFDQRILGLMLVNCVVGGQT